MYIDCKTCGFESEAFIALGPNYEEQLAAAVASVNCSVEKCGNDWSFKCPNGHEASMLPIIIRFMKRHKDFKVS